MIYGTNITYHQADDYADHYETFVGLDNGTQLVVYYMVTRKGTIEIMNDYMGMAAHEEVVTEPEVTVKAVHEFRVDLPDDIPMHLPYLDATVYAAIQESIDVLGQPESQSEKFWDVVPAETTFIPERIMRKNGWAR